MNPRWTRALGRCVLGGFLAAALMCPEATRSQPVPTVDLKVELAQAWPIDGAIMFQCLAALINDTGKALEVKTCYTSPYDGLWLVVLDAKGNVLHRQAHTSHQSPQRPDPAPVPLFKGTTRADLRFQIKDLPKGVDTYQILLVGDLPGSGHHGILCSNLVSVTVTKKKD